MTAGIFLLVEYAASLINFEVTALKTFNVALDYRISYSSIADVMRKSIVTKTLLKFFLI